MPQPPEPVFLILAAGAASRMRGVDKLLEPVAGVALIRRVVQAAQGAGGPVVVALSPDHPARRAALAGLSGALTLVDVPDAALGMSASLRAGERVVPAGHGLILLLADLPEITALDLTRFRAACLANPRALHRGMDAAGQMGHPVHIPADLRAEIPGLRGDQGARAILQAHAARLRPLPLPDSHATTDLDTPEAWAEWRARQGPR